MQELPGDRQQEGLLADHRQPRDEELADRLEERAPLLLLGIFVRSDHAVGFDVDQEPARDAVAEELVGDGHFDPDQPLAFLVQLGPAMLTRGNRGSGSPHELESMRLGGLGTPAPSSS